MVHPAGATLQEGIKDAFSGGTEGVEEAQPEPGELSPALLPLTAAAMPSWAPGAASKRISVWDVASPKEAES